MTGKIDALKALYTRLIDSRDGYGEALDHVSNRTLKTVLTDLHRHRERDAAELRGYFRREGVALDDDGSLPAAAHRTFLEVKTKIVENDDAAMLAEILRGEKRLLTAYEKTMGAVCATGPDFALILRQKADLEQAIAEHEALEVVTA